MADTRPYYAVETQAHRDDYDKKDATGETLEGDDFWKSKFGAPGVLKPGLDLQSVLKKWKSNLPVRSK